MTTLATIPLEVLLLVLRELNTIDVVRLGMTCKDFYESTQAHHVWLDQTQNHRRRAAALKLSVPSPTSLTTEALKRFAVLQAKLRIRCGRSSDQDDVEKPRFAACGTILLPGSLDIIFLPGGEFLISINESDGVISLQRIKLSGGHLSLIRVNYISGGELDQGEVTRSEILPAMVPHPIFSYARANSVYLFGIGPGGEVNLETEFSIPNRSKLLWVGGQGRIVGRVFQMGFESPVVIVAHLDHPGVTLEIQLPPECRNFTGDMPTHNLNPFLHVVESWKVYFPTPNLAVIHGSDSVLAYTLPTFTTLSRGKHSLGGPIWSLSDVIGGKTEICRRETNAGAANERSLAPDHRLNIHFLHKLDGPGSRRYIGLTTLNIDPSNLCSSSGIPTYRRVASRFPANGLVAVGTLHRDLYHSRTKYDEEGLDVWVTPLEDLALAQAAGEGRGPGSYHVYISGDELEPDLEWEGVDFDEASGRIFIWGPAYRWKTPPETRVFVGELVS